MEDIVSFPILLTIIELSVEQLKQMQSPGFYLICSAKQDYPYPIIIDSSSGAKNARRLANEDLADWFALYSHCFAVE